MHGRNIDALAGIWGRLPSPNSRGVVKTDLVCALLETRGCRWTQFKFQTKFVWNVQFICIRLSLNQFDRRNGPPGVPFLSHWGAEEEV